MFALSQIEHDLPMPPHLLSRPLPDAIKAELERLFLDKITRMLVPFSRGISIAGKILLGSASNTRTKPLSLTALVSFRLLMFKPFNGEVLVGRISGYDDKGLQVSLDFFSDICIPGHLMQYGTGSIKGDGLGLLAWWVADEEGEEAAEQEQ